MSSTPEKPRDTEKALQCSVGLLALKITPSDLSGVTQQSAVIGRRMSCDIEHASTTSSGVLATGHGDWCPKLQSGRFTGLLWRFDFKEGNKARGQVRRQIRDCFYV